MLGFSSSTRDKLTDIDNGLCIPLKLLLKFSLFQYLVTTYSPRRQEHRVRLLVVVAVLSFASLVPFALPRRALLRRNLNALSEVCSVLTFLLQIAILTRDVTKRLKIRSLLALMWCAETLDILSLGVLVVNVIDLFAPVIAMELVELLDSIVLHVSLLFIVFFRFYFLGMAKGFRKVLAGQKTEVVVYILFVTHKVPFVLLHHLTTIEWHHIQGLWMRVTIALCLSLTIRARLRSHRSSKHNGKDAKDTTGFYAGPAKSQLDATEIHKPGDVDKSPFMNSPVAIAPAPPQKAAWKN